MSNFALWHPSCTADEGGFRCVADVTAIEFLEVHEGTEALMTTFAGALGLGGGVQEWNVSPFLSPYYAYELWPEQRPFAQAEPDLGDWRNHFGLAWRVSMLLDEQPPFRYGGLGPFYADGIDSTWADEPTYTGADGEEHTIVVLADVGGTGDVSFLDGLVSPANVEVTLVPTQFLPLYRVTLRMGLAYPPDTIPGLEAILRAFSVNLYSTHHTLTAGYHVPWPTSIPW